MSTRRNMKSARRKKVKERRVAKRREKAREEKALQDRQIDRSPADSTIELQEEAPMPGRNEPCPIHPEFKLKKCPHGCLGLFRRHRSRVAGDVRVVPVDDEDDRKGRMAREVHPGLTEYDDLSQALEGL